MRATAAITTMALLALAAADAPPKLGGWTSAGVTPENSQTLLDALRGGDDGYSDSVGATRVCFTAITRVETQVVAGTNYRFYIDGCAVRSSKLAGKCATHGLAHACVQPAQYIIQVFEQVWTDTLEVESIAADKSGGGSGDKKSSEIAAAVQAYPDADSDEDSTAMPEPEKRQVNAWIAANGLNQFGDAKHTMYPGGTPLFDEHTGESVDRYEYILRRHPGRPWLLQATLHANVLAAAETVGASAVHKQPAQGLMSLIASVGVLTVLLALIAGVKARRTRRHFVYDSVANREI